MATKVVVKVFPGGLRAVNDAEASKLDDLIGREVMATISQPRNLKFHRKFFALLNTTMQMADLEINPEQFRALVLTGAGYCTFHEIAGKLVAIPKSISFAAMDDTEFNRLYQDCLTFICATYLDDSPEAIDMMLQFM